MESFTVIPEILGKTYISTEAQCLFHDHAWAKKQDHNPELQIFLHSCITPFTEVFSDLVGKQV